MKVEEWNGHSIRFVERDGEWWAVLADVEKAAGKDFLDAAAMIYMGYLPLDDFLKEGESIKQSVNWYSSIIALTTNKRLIYITQWYGEAEYIKFHFVATLFSNIVCKPNYRRALENWLVVYEIPSVDMPEVIQEVYRSIGKKRGEIRPVEYVSTKKSETSEISGVYLIRSDNGLIKIGCTGNIKKRFRALKVSCPCKIELIGFYKCQDYTSEEARLHKQFANKRKIGEWFDLDESDLMALNERFGLGLSVSEQIYRKYGTPSFEKTA